MRQKYYITTAIAYASGKPHIGNTYEAILADSIARFKRFEGYDVYLQTGTDEHGQKIEEKAKAAGITPKEYVDNVAGDIYKGYYEGMYCVPCESFFTPSQLKDGKCPDCGREVQPAKEEAYFFKMSKYAPKLIDYINTHPDFIKPVSRKNEMMNNFLLPGLQDLCVSRTSFTWGIPVEFDPKHVVYVWLDALANYITCIGYECGGESSDLFNKLWPADLHVIGKDIIRFHTIYWPIFLMSLDLPLPKTVFGHPWLLQGEGKMSKSKGNVMYADDLCDLFGVDAVRYFVLHDMPFDNDGSITWDVLIERLNADLANTLGNLVNRTVAMSNKYFGGEVRRTGVEEPVDTDLKTVVTGALGRVRKAVDDLRMSDALNELMNLFQLYNLVESISSGANLLSPFLPATAERILKQLNIEPRAIETLETFGLYPNGAHVAEKPEILFARLDPKAVMEQVEKLMAKQAKPAAPEAPALAPIKDEIAYEDFEKLDLRLAKVVACEEVKRSKKLLKLTVSLGNEERTVVSGIKNWYQPADLIGKTVVLVANLKPVTLCGVESHGMILCASDPEDKALAFVTPEKALDAGWVVR